MITAVNCGGLKNSKDVKKAFTQKVKLETLKQKGSYALGYNMGQSVRDAKDDVDLFIMMQGVVDAYISEEKAQMTIEDMKKALTDFQKEVRKRFDEKRKIQGEKRKIQGEKNIEEGKKFLEENATKEGVKVTASGLQYIIIKAGTGANPKTADTVKVNYKGALINGTEFDSSYKRGTPSTFPLTRVIKGWTEGLQLMKVGSVFKFFVPANLAYGERNMGKDITPNACLIFEVELLEINPQQAPPSKKQAAKPAPTKKKVEKPVKK